MPRPTADRRSPTPRTRRDRLHAPLQRASPAPLAGSAAAAQPAATEYRPTHGRRDRARPDPPPRPARRPNSRVPTRRLAAPARRLLRQLVAHARANTRLRRTPRGDAPRVAVTGRWRDHRLLPR